MQNNLSKNIYYLRKKLNLSKSELAKKINVNQSTISRWENGEMGITVDNAYELANALNIPLPKLIGNDLSKEKDDAYIEDEFSQLFNKVKNKLSNDDRATIEFIIHKTLNNNDSKE